jgi:hypothetical protein
VLASALNRPLVLHTRAGDTTAQPFPPADPGAEHTPPGPPLRIDLTLPPDAAVTATGGPAGGLGTGGAEGTGGARPPVSVSDQVLAVLTGQAQDVAAPPARRP